nr:MAG TPA: Germination protein [Caudoviricetes sp.]
MEDSYPHFPQIFIHKKPDFCVKNFFFNGTSDAIIAVQ